MHPAERQVQREFEEAERQIQREFKQAVEREICRRRPIIHRLNADSGFLLQIPRPAAAIQRGGRAFYNVLIDPSWLAEPQSESECQSITDVEHMVQRIEEQAKQATNIHSREKMEDSSTSIDEEMEDCSTSIDVVAISHESTSHCHKMTLLDIDKSVLVIATESAAGIIRSWNHFRSIGTTPIGTVLARSGLEFHWEDGSILPLPQWLAISHLKDGTDSLRDRSTLAFSFQITPSPPSSRSTTTTRSARSLPNGWHQPLNSSSQAECIVYAPQGIHAKLLEPLAKDPALSVLALMYGRYDVDMNAPSLGWLAWWYGSSSRQRPHLQRANMLQAQQLTNARNLIDMKRDTQRDTKHDTSQEVNRSIGFFDWFWGRNPTDVKSPLRAEHEEEEDEPKIKSVRYLELRSGYSQVLE